MTTFTYRRKMQIEWGHCDPAGIVFNVRFFEFFDHSTWLLLGAALGVEPQNLNKAFDIIGAPLVDARATFIKPAKFGETIEIASRVSEVRRSSFDVEHRITINGELAVDGGLSRVWASFDKDYPNKIAVRPIPSEVIAKFG